MITSLGTTIIVSVNILTFLVVVILVVRLNKKNLNIKKRLQEKTEQLEDRANRDTLTGLYTRSFLMERLQEMLLDEDRVFTAFYNVDIANIKLVNDAYGHDVGDKAICHISQLISDLFTEADDCICIYQTEFFIVDCMARCKEDVIIRTDALIRSLNKTIVIDRMEIGIRVNVGIAHGPEHSLDSKLLLKKANIARVEAAKLGPNQSYMFRNTLYKDSIKRMTLEKQLHRAVARNEFELYYQPRIEMDDLKVVGCEALIRWNHPEGHIVYPNSFISLAETMGFISEITKWVTRRVATQVMVWDAMGYQVKVSFNISGKEFDDEFITLLSRIIKEEKVNPALLEVEITETAALKDIEHSKFLVNMLNELGVTVALDDFGTGYSSMTYIKKLKASKLKIDKSFIDDIDDYEQRVIVDSMIQLGQRLNYRINVEGVETLEQLEILKELQVDEVQGWYFSKAVKAAEFLEYVKKVGMKVKEVRQSEKTKSTKE